MVLIKKKTPKSVFLIKFLERKIFRLINLVDSYCISFNVIYNQCLRLFDGVRYYITLERVIAMLRKNNTNASSVYTVC